MWDLLELFSKEISTLDMTIDLHNEHLSRVSSHSFYRFHLFLKEDRFSEFFEFITMGWAHMDN